MDLKSIVDDTLALCSEKMKTHGVRLKVAEIPPELRISCRPTEISQVFLNLLSNSFDASWLFRNDGSKWGSRIRERCLRYR